MSNNPKGRHPTFEKHSPRCSRVPFAWSATFAGTFNSLSKVLSTFPSRYLYAIVFGEIFSLRRNLPPKFTLPSQETRLFGTQSDANNYQRCMGVSPVAPSLSRDLSPTHSLTANLHTTILGRRPWFSEWASPCSFAITKSIHVGFISAAYLYA